VSAPVDTVEAAALQEARTTLQRVFGFRGFRPPQDQVVAELLAGRDALVLMPTGGGKSLCYQIPALVRSGTAVVVSPLIALMQDQVRALQQSGVRAAYLNSTLTPAAARVVEQRLQAGGLDLLYVAPERLLTERTLELLSRVRLALFAIDEAHCVSQWGHDFRPEYLQLSLLQQRFPGVPRLALTATADALTRDEIAERLGLHAARRFVSGFDRPNIRYHIAEKRSPRSQLLDFLRREHPGDAGIVYCLSRKRVEATAQWLRQQGWQALPYHAGLPVAERQASQERFIREEGLTMVATIAFGMGIDKPDVRFVAHLDLPRSVEAYYQETGRAGRDGLLADAWMVYGLQDVVTLRQMLESSASDEQRKRVERRRLEAILGLCEVTSCRRQVLLRYFGETLERPCGNCDNCLQPAQTWDGTEAAQKALSCVYRTGQRFGVNHLIDVLRGNANARVSSFGHQRLSTFGIGQELEAGQWRSVFRQLVARGLLTVDLAGHGSLRLTEQARPVLRGEQHLKLRREGGKPRRRASMSSPPQAGRGDPLFDALRELRRRLASTQGVPPYVIFNDATLLEMAARRPASAEELRCITGVGELKLARYGGDFLQAIAVHVAGTGHLEGTA